MLERLIRALAGTLVLVSLTLGYFVNPEWFLLTAFVGINLLQSSLTRFCPAEMIVQRILNKIQQNS